MIDIFDFKGKFVLLPFISYVDSNEKKITYGNSSEENETCYSLSFDGLDYFIPENEFKKFKMNFKSFLTKRKLHLGVLYDISNKVPVPYYINDESWHDFLFINLISVIYFEKNSYQLFNIESKKIIRDHKNYIEEINTYEKLDQLYNKYNIYNIINNYIIKNSLKNNLDSFFDLLYEYDYDSDDTIDNPILKKYVRMYKLRKII